MRHYEIILILRPSLTEAQVEEAVTKMVATIEEKGGHVDRMERWGLRTLAYSIGKNRKGHYVLLNITYAPEEAKLLAQKIKIDTQVLRHLFLITENTETEPSIVLKAQQQKAEKRVEE